MVAGRPYSSDQKDREKDKRIINQKKILPYDTSNTLLSFKAFGQQQKATGPGNKMMKKK